MRALEARHPQARSLEVLDPVKGEGLIKACSVQCATGYVPCAGELHRAGEDRVYCHCTKR